MANYLQGSVICCKKDVSRHLIFVFFCFSTANFDCTNLRPFYEIGVSETEREKLKF